MVKLNNKNYWQQSVQFIASYSLLTKVLADFLSVIYLLTLVLKHATKSYTRPLFVNILIQIRGNETCLKKENQSI